ncbi:Far upstream element-binding protein 1 [Larimichthys crocea]|uniref:Uncharacterized protein n=1 Tax=Larimichthys crocea TaxID=215358 RepID=A0ACD3R893_LARCR|nr:Far upstream element-binding protein 1 [Larimichthys crocea]
MTPTQPGRPTTLSTTSSRRGLCQPSTQLTQLEVPKLQGTSPSPAQTPGAQPDYTKAWEEYYKKMAQAGGSVPGTAAAAPGAAGGAASTTGGQPDYSAAWAEYYRQQAAYYGQSGQAPGQPATPQQGQTQ